jgi:hypothetical protein
VSVEVTRELPPGDEKLLDYEWLENAVYIAIKAALRDLQGTTTGTRIRTLRRLADGSSSRISGYHVSCPSYRDRAVSDRIKEISNSAEFHTVSEYMWDRGAEKQVITGPDPGRQAWNQILFNNLVYMPLLNALEFTGKVTFIREGNVKPWVAFDDVIKRVVQKRIAAIRDKRNGVGVYIAYCPIADPQFPSDRIDFGHGILVKKLTMEERLVFEPLYSQYANDPCNWSGVFKTPGFLESMVEITVSVPLSTGGNTYESVARKLNAIKWALMIASGMSTPFSEGRCLIEARDETLIGGLMRDPSVSGPKFVVDEAAIDRTRTLLDHYFPLAENTADLANAMWHFGRASVASIERDMLLEAAIGIDALTNRSSRDSKYRFCLHTAALLHAAGVASGDTYDLLRRIYDRRSGAAHGGSASDLGSLPSVARQLLANAIAAAVDLTMAGKLGIRGTASVSEALEQFVAQKLMRPA